MKINVYVAGFGAAARRICWYEGTSDAQVEKAIRMQLRLPQDAQFLLNDADGDVVPVSSTLPTSQHYTLFLPDEDEGVEVDTSVDTSPSIGTSVDTSPQITQKPDTSESSPPASKRRRLVTSEVINTSGRLPVTMVEDVKDVKPVALVTSVGSHLPPPRFADVITLFINTFTEPIANDDNVNFIPNIGRFALYALYMELVHDTRLHPKREDVFYKMTSMAGKVDRQRVNRYYRCSAHRGEGTEFVLIKPLGKGVLLRRYREVGSLEILEEAVKSTALMSWLQMDPKDVVTQYVRFVDGFIPITRSEYRTQSSEDKARSAAPGIEKNEVQRE